MSQTNRLLVSGVFAAYILFGLAPRSFAVDAFESGMEAYKKGDLLAAQTFFTKLITDSPRDFRGYYQLGNVHLASGNYEEAGKFYRLCIHNNPDMNATLNCKQALDYLANKVRHRTRAQVRTHSPTQVACKPISAPTPEGTTQNASARADTGPTSDSEAKSLLESHADLLGSLADKRAKAQKDRILAEADATAKEIKDAAEHEVKEGHANANQWWRFSDGSLGVQMEPEDERRIRQQAEDKVRATMDEAHRKIKALESTSSHVNNSADGLKSQLSKGSHLQPHGTNLYVRNYRKPDM